MFPKSSTPARDFNPGKKGILEEGEMVMHKDATDEAMDATLIAGAQKVEHYEISGYGSAACYADMLGYEGLAKRLRLNWKRNNRPTPNLKYWQKTCSMAGPFEQNDFRTIRKLTSSVQPPRHSYCTYFQNIS